MSTFPQPRTAAPVANQCAAVCARDVRGVVYCEECFASQLSGTMPPPGSTAVPPGGNCEPVPPQPRLGRLAGIHSRRRRHVQRRIRQGLRSRADLRHPDLDDRSHQRHLWPGHRGLRASICRSRPIRRRRPARWDCRLPIRSGSTTCSAPVRLRRAGARPLSRNARAPSPGNPGDCSPGRSPPRRSRLAGAGRRLRPDRTGRAVSAGEVGTLHFDWIWRFWPLILIAVGIRVLMQRQRRGW